jgi:proteasome lid subunit RPN8/RPN11
MTGSLEVVLRGPLAGCRAARHSQATMLITINRQAHALMLSAANAAHPHEACGLLFGTTYFHSHPNGLARPSATDAASAARDGRVWIIVADGAITCWCDEPEGFEPLSYAITGG